MDKGHLGMLMYLERNLLINHYLSIVQVCGVFSIEEFRLNYKYSDFGLCKLLERWI